MSCHLNFSGNHNYYKVIDHIFYLVSFVSVRSNLANSHDSDGDAWHRKNTGRRYARAKRQQPAPYVANISADFVGVIDQQLSGHSDTERYRFVTLDKRGEFAWERVDSGRTSRRADITKRSADCPYAVRATGRGDVFLVTANGTEPVDPRELVRSADGDAIEPLGRQGMFRVVRSDSSDCHMPDCKPQFDVISGGDCRFIVVRRSPRISGAARQFADSVKDEPPPAIAKRHPVMRKRLAERAGDGHPVATADWIRAAMRRALAGVPRIKIRQATQPPPVYQFPRIMSARFHLGDRLLEKLSRTASRVDAGWGPWGQWGACSVTCGSGGVRTRSRQCASSSQGCSGVSSQQRSCGPSPSCNGE